MVKKKESTSGVGIMNWLQVIVDSDPLMQVNKNVCLLSFITYCKQKEGRQRGTWNGKKADNDFYKKIVSHLVLFLELFPSFWFVSHHMLLLGGHIWSKKPRTSGRECWSESIITFNAGDHSIMAIFCLFLEEETHCFL